MNNAVKIMQLFVSDQESNDINAAAICWPIDQLNLHALNGQRLLPKTVKSSLIDQSIHFSI